TRDEFGATAPARQVQHARKVLRPRPFRPSILLDPMSMPGIIAPVLSQGPRVRFRLGQESRREMSAGPLRDHRFARASTSALGGFRRSRATENHRWLLYETSS